MAPTPRIWFDTGPHAPMEGSDHSIDSVSVATPDVDTVVATIPLPGLGEMAGGSSYWPSAIRGASIWEVSLIVVLFLLIAALVGIRMLQAFSTREPGATQSPSADTPAPGAAGSTRSNANPNPSAAPAAGAQSAEQPRSYEDVVSAETPPELLSDEGRVVRLLVKHGGQIRQHQIADETGWSKSKVSRILSSMYDDGTIEKTSVGRENVISLPERSDGEPTGTGTGTTTDNPNNPVP
nr:helix-turn-helix domain-containing protein [Natrialba taiwanensis]